NFFSALFDAQKAVSNRTNITWKPTIAVGTTVAGCPPGGRGRSPVPRLPQNVACRFPALRSSEVASQRGDSLQLRVTEIQLWSEMTSQMPTSGQRRRSPALKT